ncbi:carbohydrate ABC transporter permease [Streptacidiphilus sp. PAMC 29251]
MNFALYRNGIARTLWFIVAACFLLFFVLPLAWLVLATTKTDNQLIQLNPLAFGSLHDFARSWHNVAAYQDGIVFTWLGNSALYSFAALVITLATAIPAGYGLALGRVPGRRILLSLTLVVMIIPPAALTLPLFLEMNAIHEIGSAWSVILPFAFFPFGVYLAYIFFSSNLPPDLLAAARLDGCSEWGVLWHIALPLAKPIVALISFFSFVGNWTNYFLPLVMLPNDGSLPIQVGLNQLLSSTPAFNPVAGSGQIDFNRPELALTTLIAVAPVLIVFLFSQRALVSGMLSGASKE